MASCLRGLTRIPRTPFSLTFLRYYAEPAAKKQETDRVVIPVIFRERVKNATGVYQYSPEHYNEDVAAYKKQLDIQKQDISLLDFMKEGETAETVSGAALYERYGEKIREDEKNKKFVTILTRRREDTVLEHPVDLFKNVTSKNYRTFHELWLTVMDWEFKKKELPPPKDTVIRLMELSRTRRHFVRTLVLFHQLEQRELNWSDREKEIIIQFFDKHRYPQPILSRLFRQERIFFNKQHFYELAYVLLLNVKFFDDAARVEQTVKREYKSFSSSGFHKIIPTAFNLNRYDHVLSLTKDLVTAANAEQFSIAPALWEYAFQSLFLSGKSSEIEEFATLFTTHYASKKKLAPTKVAPFIAIGHLDNKNTDAAKVWLLKTKGGNEIAKRYLETQSKSADKTVAAKATALLSTLSTLKPPQQQQQPKKEQAAKK